MRSLNRVMLMGHLAADVEIRQTKNGTILANFPVATNRIVMDGGEKKEFADFHRVIAWGKLAEISQKLLQKGKPVLIEGKIVNRSYEDKSGVRHYRTEIIADDIHILTWQKGKAGEPNIGIKGVIEEKEALEESAII